MSKYVDKMNLPQYRFFNNMIEREQEVKDLASDAIAGCMSVATGSKQNRLKALAMLTKARKTIPAMVFRRKRTS
ncbi:MAG: hypothetical protein LUK37_22510 [Clostridia bacterium]|nr:hypothetical protein [Clostridia bacterium]